jgi:hypothetical protein
MSAAQKKARENFKKAIAYRKKTGCSLKQAFAYVKGGKVGVVKKAVVKKKAVKKIVRKKAAKKIGNVKREYQLQRLSDSKILTYDLGSGKELFLDSPDRGYMFTEEEAKYRKGIFANKGIQVKVIKYNRDWWKVSGVKKAAKKKTVSSHKDTKSHNVNIRVVSGVSKGKEKSLTMWKDIYGKLSSQYVSIKDMKQKRKIAKDLKQAREVIQKLK